MMILDGGSPYDERFEQIYRQNYGRVWRYFRSNRVADDEAHDLAQDTFQRVFEHIRQLRNNDAGPFVAIVAKRVLLNRIRARATQKRSAHLVDMDDPELIFTEPAAPAEPDYADRQAIEARWERVQKALQSLPPGQRQALVLWIEGHRYGAIAKILGISMDAVKSRLRDAKRYLREQLGEKP